MSVVVVLTTVSVVGIAALPDYLAHEAGDLVRVLPDLAGPEVEAYFVYPEELRSSKRIAVFRDFLLRKVSAAKHAHSGTHPGVF